MDVITVHGEAVTEQETAALLRQAVATGKCGAVLQVFWAAFNWHVCESEGCRSFGRCAKGSCLPASRKRKLLKAVAAINLYEQPKWSRNKRIRSGFNDRGPYREIKQRPCFICGEPHNHRHHIVQIQHGGHNAPRNIVLLCRTCHNDIHKTP